MSESTKESFDNTGYSSDESSSNESQESTLKRKTDFILHFLKNAIEPSENVLFESYKTFPEIESDFELVDRLPPANSENFRWDLMALKCLHVNLVDANPIGTDRTLSMLVLREKMSKELGVTIPEEYLWEYLEKKWKIFECNSALPIPIDFEPATQLYTVSDEIIEIADEAFKENKHRVKTRSELSAKKRNLSIQPKVAATGSPTENPCAMLSFDNIPSSSDVNMEEFPSISCITNEGNNTGDHVDKETSTDIHVIQKSPIKGHLHGETNTSDPINGETNTSDPLNGETNTSDPVNGETNTSDAVNGETNTSDPVNGETNTSDPLNGETNTSDPVNGETNTSDPLNGETNTSDPVNRETNTSDPVNGETNTSDPVNRETNTSDPVNGETTTSHPVNGETTTSHPVNGETTTSHPLNGETTTRDPVNGETTTSDPINGETTTSNPVNGETTTSNPVNGDTTKSNPVNGETNTSNPVNGETNTSNPVYEVSSCQVKEAINHGNLVGQAAAVTNEQVNSIPPAKKVYRINEGATTSKYVEPAARRSFKNRPFVKGVKSSARLAKKNP